MADAKKVMADYTEAYKIAHGKKPKIEAGGGWYKINGEKSVRLAELENMAQALKKSGTAKPQSSIKTTAATKKSAAPKPKTAVASKAKKAAAPKTKKPLKKANKKTAKPVQKKASFKVITQGKGLKPKAFWQKVVIENQHKQCHAHRKAAIS